MTNTDATARILGKRVLELRKDRGWSQPELGKMIGTSGAVIGRYERAEITPSVDVVRRFAEAFGVTLDFMISEKEMPQALKDPGMMDRWRALDGLPGDDRDRILYMVDGLIRDARTRLAYSA
jgi:transcriptional regulator with XRE-family HTH domain